MLGIVGDIQIVTGVISGTLDLVNRVYDQIDRMRNNRELVLSFQEKLEILKIILNDLRPEQLGEAHLGALQYLRAHIEKSYQCIMELGNAGTFISLIHAGKNGEMLNSLSNEITTRLILLITAIGIRQLRAIDSLQPLQRQGMLSIHLSLADIINRARSGDQAANVAQYKLGGLYEYGSEEFRLEPDKLEAFKWYAIAANNHHNDAQYHLAEAFKNGNDRLDIVPNLEISLLWYEKAANEDCQSANVAQYTLAEAYRGDSSLVGNKRNGPKALSLYNRAAERYHCDAQIFLAKAYEYGNRDLGVSINPQEAFGWYSRAANNDSSCANVAQYRLGQAYERGEPLIENRVNTERALYWYKRSADNDHQDARRAWERLKNSNSNPRPNPF